MTQNPQQKKLIRDIYLKKAEKKAIENHPLLSGCSSYLNLVAQSSAQNIFQRKLDLKSINIIGISHQMRCKCNGCCKWSKPALCLIHGNIFLVKRKKGYQNLLPWEKEGDKKFRYVKPQTISIYWFYLLHNYVDTSTKSK